ncbi:DUF3077 domain-containing protein [Pseudomonas gingeri]|uniref:DUF3077 domain-containing protein n=1 Tax=Pseudomonas gingeri TaxID=117681 RepID=UPI0015A4864A|nr:DUF3077 domain-containing protein [Pseudomonas gingeri]NWA00400.1 DUF3077 domain-containing protein [Pseudomonas gingeri]NWA14886.1 DUF3077 domain-containing protein [Pseudomonas gingeri]NWA58032.1 DUF3077 domain-containing protein [Pseudomonas gingeri]NWA96870.1 DUF3077 domain-containing protein [Pseudomonas gingeri]NWB03810.1 DUF3077 domain-containing protein [Pseudomonas gingeri]
MKDCTSTRTRHTPFGSSLTGDYMFSVNPDISVQHALEQASLLLNGAAMVAEESQDAKPHVCHTLNWVMLQLVEMSKGLVDASLESVVNAE